MGWQGRSEGSNTDFHSHTVAALRLTLWVFYVVLFGDMQETMSSNLHLQALWGLLERCLLSTWLSRVLFKFGLGRAPALSACLTPSNTHLKYTVVTPISGWCKIGFFQQGIMIMEEAGTATP